MAVTNAAWTASHAAIDASRRASSGPACPACPRRRAAAARSAVASAASGLRRGRRDDRWGERQLGEADPLGESDRSARPTVRGSSSTSAADMCLVLGGQRAQRGRGVLGWAAIVAA